MSEMLVVLGAHGFVGKHLLERARARWGEARVVAGPSWRSSPRKDAYRDALCASLPPLDPVVLVNAVGGASGNCDVESLNIEPAEVVKTIITERGLVDGLIHIGSAAEYGDIAGPAPESASCAPTTAYGRAKLVATNIALSTPRCVVIRPFSIVGPGMPEQTLLGRLMRAVFSGEDTFACGSLGGVRDYVSVDDVSDAIVTAARLIRTGDEICGHIVNVGTGTGIVTRQAVEHIVSKVGAEIRILEDRTHADRSVSVADVREATRLLGWRARTRGLDVMDGVFKAPTQNEKDPDGAH